MFVAADRLAFICRRIRSTISSPHASICLLAGLDLTVNDHHEEEEERRQSVSAERMTDENLSSFALHLRARATTTTRATGRSIYPRALPAPLPPLFASAAARVLGHY